jgi:hypothetical protein
LFVFRNGSKAGKPNIIAKVRPPVKSTIYTSMYALRTQFKGSATMGALFAE